jgi:hypothetical protein
MDTIAMLVIISYLVISGLMSIGIFTGLLLKWLGKILD